LVRLLIKDVQALVKDGELARNKAKVLLVQLWKAWKAIVRDNSDKAVRHLEQFIHHVEILVKQGNLEPMYGDTLIQEAEIIIGQIKGKDQMMGVEMQTNETKIFLPLLNP
jgi:polyhydroxyalkanoate synthesis regulator phasin